MFVRRLEIGEEASAAALGRSGGMEAATVVVGQREQVARVERWAIGRVGTLARVIGVHARRPRAAIRCRTTDPAKGVQGPGRLPPGEWMHDKSRAASMRPLRNPCSHGGADRPKQVQVEEADAGHEHDPRHEMPVGLP